MQNQIVYQIFKKLKTPMKEIFIVFQKYGPGLPPGS